MTTDVDSIMALADQIREKAQGSMDAPFWRHVAAAVEQLVRERDSFYMDYRMKCDEETKALQVKLERAEAEVARLQAGGCARNQGLTQFCAEAVDAIRQRDEAMALLKEARKHVTAAEIDCQSCADVEEHCRIVRAAGGTPNPWACCADLGKAIDDLLARIDAALKKEQYEALQRLTENAEELGLYDDEKSV